MNISKDNLSVMLLNSIDLLKESSLLSENEILDEINMTEAEYKAIKKGEIYEFDWEKYPSSDFDYWLKDLIMDRIIDAVDDDYIFRDISSPYEVVNSLFDQENINGTYTFSSYEADKFISYFRSAAADEYEYEMSNFGSVLHNPFDEPEAFQVCMILNLGERLFCETELYDEIEARIDEGSWSEKPYITFDDAKLLANEWHININEYIDEPVTDVNENERSKAR